MTILDINNNSFYNKFDYNVEKAVEALKKEFGQQFSISKLLILSKIYFPFNLKKIFLVGD